MPRAGASIARRPDVCLTVGMRDYSTVGARLWALREGIGLARDKVAALAGAAGHDLTGQSIYRYEKGEMVLKNVDYLSFFAELYGTDERWIVRGDPTDPAVLAAFAEFEERIAPLMKPPITVGERGKLIWIRHHNPRPEKYLEDLMREREGESSADAAASAEATSVAHAKGVLQMVPRKTKRHRDL